MAIRFLSFSLLFVGLAGLAVMALWNALLPPILGVRAISFWQAIGLLVLSRILFGGFRGYGPRGYDFGPNYGHGRAEWKEKMNERWQKMTPEQRDQIRQQWRDRCGPGRRGWWGRGSQFEQPGSPDSGETGKTAI